MKNKILLSALSLLSLAACTKQTVDNNSSGGASIVAPSSVPAVVRTAFDNSFSGTNGIEWQRNSSNSFTVQFNMSNQRHDAGFDDTGHQSSHNVICLEAAVPQVVLDNFRQRFPTDNVYEWKLTNEGNWKPHFMRGTIKYEATFSATGIFIKFEQAG